MRSINTEILVPVGRFRANGLDRSRFLARFTSRSTWLAALVALALLLGPPSTHAQRRDFAASYQLTNIEEAGSSVSLTITLKLFNYSGAEIRNGAVVLCDSSGDLQPNRKAIDAFDLIESLPAYRATTLRHRFTVPSSEYARWKQGGEPELVFLKPDSEGNAHEVHIDLRREPAPDENLQSGNAEANQ